MVIPTIDDELSLLMADADAILTLAAELGEATATNSPEHFKTHAIYDIAETQLRRLDRTADKIMELRRLLKTE